MLEKLKGYYQTAFTEQINPDDNDKFWFQMENGHTFGITKTALTNGELNLLNHLFTSIDFLAERIFNSRIKQEWHEFLFEHTNVLPASGEIEAVRIFYFFLKSPLEDPNSFEEAIIGGFGQPVLFWQSRTHGFIVDQQPQGAFTKKEFNQLIDTLISDFFVEIHGYIGQLNKFDLSLKEKFTYECQCMEVIHQRTNQEKVITFYEGFPLLLIESPTLADPRILSDYLVESVQEQEMLHTLQVFFQNNLNASVTAKKLYIHRNSLQYRLDKFIEKTGIDIRSFSNATFVMLAIFMIDKSNSVVQNA
ncbi:PucR family transcriptional regulator [Cytobacillus massiliigabonensis]|uniref:PucR family transcriptional regulator n=1 Tax=Cytobacillus massiliigabonensis TaxID=1871011 RepID=UPI000C866967|nr:helix-turn-helix domain-containing protein [Cytobacillus massiliigabonensis]